MLNNEHFLIVVLVASNSRTKYEHYIKSIQIQSFFSGSYYPGLQKTPCLVTFHVLQTLLILRWREGNCTFKLAFLNTTYNLLNLGKSSPSIFSTICFRQSFQL